MREIIVDSFAGGGGASLGIFQALGRGPDIAINHDHGAIEMHRANHPQTKHYEKKVWKLRPIDVTRGRPVGLLWSSPDCKHFSRAKGAKPVDKHIRGLAWTVIKWAQEVSPRVIILENVREFEEYGPLLPRWECRDCEWRGTEGQAVLVRRRRKCPRCDSLALRETEDLIPDPTRKGLTFRRWVGRLQNLGYKVQWKVLNAADYGAPTHRRRLFLIARNDGEPIVWPEPTHGDPRKISEASLFAETRKPWNTAASCIDWSLPCPSIFLTREEGRAAGVNRPLAEKTLQRIARGIKRYVLDNPRPFLVVCNHGGVEFRGSEVGAPLPTVTAARDAHGLVTPFLARIGQAGGNGKYTNGVDEPLTTVVSKAEHCLITPYLVQRYGERDGQEPRTSPVDAPFGVVTPRGNVGSLVAPVLVPMTHENRAVPPSEPLPTATTQTNRAPLVAAFLAKHFGGVVGQPADAPIGTVTARDHHSVVAANLIHLNHGDKQSSGVDQPMRTVTAAGKHAAMVYSFLTKYYGTAVGQPLGAPLHTATDRDRFGLVTVHVNGESYVIVDIGMRMLRPRELARGQGFPDSYVLTGTATNQTARIGNSVCPCLAKALVAANYQPACIPESEVPHG